jgi:hypothetical protein
MTELPNLFPLFLQSSVKHCPRYPELHPAYMPCGDGLRDMPCPRCRGLRTEQKRNLSEEELEEVMRKVADKPVFNPDFGNNQGVPKWS